MSANRVAVLGIWHLGSVYSACLADLGYQVVGWDKDIDKIRDLNRGRAPLFEPGLDDLILGSVSSGQISYTNDLRTALEGAQYALITFDTPVDDNDEVDLSEILKTVEGMTTALEQDSVVIVSSQVPIGTCEVIASAIARSRPSLKFDVACAPENLRLGQAIENFKQPDRIVLGADSETTLDRVEELFKVVDAPKIRMDLKTAEMTKHALNAFLATSVSFANEIGNICDRVGADALKVAEALSADSRIGKKALLKPGLGFAGATLARDMKVLKRLSEENGYAAPLVNGVLSVNASQNGNVVARLERVYESLDGKTIGVLGLTYKPGTSTLRRSAAIEIIHQLVSKGAIIKAFDPKASPAEVQLHNEFQFCDSPYEVARGSDALVFVTRWPEFKDLDFDQIKSAMRVPVVVDTQNMLNDQQMIEKEFLYCGIGRGQNLGG